jgi:hypothetical protein
MRGANEYDLPLDTLNTIVPFAKYVVNVENKDAELNRRLKRLE